MSNNTFFALIVQVSLAVTLLISSFLSLILFSLVPQALLNHRWSGWYGFADFPFKQVLKKAAQLHSPHFVYTSTNNYLFSFKYS